MITHLILVALSGFARILVSLFPPLPDPAPILGNVNGSIGQVFAFAGSLGAWIPWGATGIALGLVAGVLAVAAVIKLIRIVASFLTLGGGSAA